MKLCRMMSIKILGELMGNFELYELNQSQEVVKLQCKYTLFKKIINILSSMTSEEELDFEIMKDAFNKVVERNDCLRIKFIKKDKKLMQYFSSTQVFEDIPVLEFETKEEQEKFIAKKRKKAIKYKKGVVIEPYFIKTYDNKYMVFLKICHLILDIYGINMIYKDLFEVYDALKNEKPLPPEPTKFEELVKKDLTKKHDEEFISKNREYFQDLLISKPEPFYAGLHGEKNPIWQKQRKKRKRAMKMFFINCDTKGYAHKIDKETCDKVMNYCKENSVSPANFLFYTASITASKINGNIKDMLPLELCNCRGTMAEKNCAGTKVQSIGCYTHIEHNESFKDNFTDFCAKQNQLYRHVGFPDQDFEMMLHTIFRSSMLETYYYLTYSFIPFKMPKGMEFNIYSNEKCALPAYVAQLYDIDSGEITMAYDVQTKIISEEDVKSFHENYIKTINQVIENDEIKIKNIKFN